VRAQAPALLQHLNLGHRPELAACLRSHGVDAETAEATALDRHGLTAVGVGPSGVSQVHLSFPAPMTRLEELGAGLCAVLHCQCQLGVWVRKVHLADHARGGLSLVVAIAAGDVFAGTPRSRPECLLEGLRHRLWAY
jgi:hypothetical protein